MLMLIEFLRWAVNLTPGLKKSIRTSQTPTHRLPAKAARSYDGSAATGVLCPKLEQATEFTSTNKYSFPGTDKRPFSPDISSPAVGSNYPPIQRVTSAFPNSFVSNFEVKNDQHYASNSRHALKSFKGTSLLYQRDYLQAEKPRFKPQK
jgi:hypothetical protein